MSFLPLRVAILALLFSLPLAAQITIQVPSQSSTILGALFFAQSGDTVEVAPGSYGEDLDFFGKDIILRSTQGPTVTFLNGFNYAPVVRLENGETAAAVIEGFTIMDGRGIGDEGGGLNIIGASPTIRDCVFLNNIGGPESTSFFDANDGFGGAVHCFAGSPTFENCQFLNNSGGPHFGLGISGGAGALHFEDNCSPVFVDCEFHGNAGGPGGLPSVQGGGSGVVFCNGPGVISFERCVFRNNVGGGGSIARGGAGVIGFQSNMLTMIDCEFVDNLGGSSATSGGGSSNQLRGAAGVLSGSGAINIRNCLFARNEGGAGGGFNQTGDGGPGAIYYNGGLALDIESSTFTENQGGDPGISAGGFSPGRPGPGAIQVVSGGTIRNCIFWSDVAAMGGMQEIDQPFGPSSSLSVGSSIVDGGFPGAFVLTVDPQFANPSLGDWRLQATSPVVDAVTASYFSPVLKTDLAGAPREFYGAQDYGAFEYVSAAFEGSLLDSFGDSETILNIAGSSASKVEVPVGAPISIAIDQPSIALAPALFGLIGKAGIPAQSDETNFAPIIGTSVLPLHDPGLFVALNAFAPYPGQFASSGPLPVSLTITGAPFPLDVVLQVLVEAQPGVLSLSNGIHLSIQ